jgi:uncharacterized membrane protein (DUF106 family)
MTPQLFIAVGVGMFIGLAMGSAARIVRHRFQRLLGGVSVITLPIIVVLVLILVTR